MRPVPFVLVASLVAIPAPAVDPPSAGYEDMAVDLLRQYLQVDTTNPPGNEMRAARFYKEILEREGIPVEIDEFAPGRANLLATLKGSGARRALILANHMDVVPADASRWTVPPFSGVVKDGLVYGRGAQDMKTEGHPAARHPDPRAAGAPAARPRPASSWPPRTRKSDFAGALARAEPGRLARPPARGRVLHHRGRRERDRRGRPSALFRRSTPPRRGRSGCASPRRGRRATDRGRCADSALNRLVRALDRVRLHKTEMKVLPGVERFFRDQAATLDGRARGVVPRPAQGPARPRGGARPSTRTARRRRCCATRSPSPW